ncbi:hypothetical protein OAG19_00570 [Akkermansiaceae bacterium]|nr:hypothetical protein [Akkermansiaceae bacterium]
MTLNFNESPNFTNLGDVTIWKGTSGDFVTNRGSLVGNYPLNLIQEGQKITLTANDGIEEATPLFFKLIADSDVGFEPEILTIGPYTLEPNVEGPDLNLYNQGDQSLVGDFTIEGGLEGDSSNGGNLNVSGNALGTGIGGRLTGPESKMYLLSGDAGTEPDTLQSVTARGNTTLGLDVNFQDGTLFVDHTNQRVGVGTNIPQDTLEVVGDSFFDGNVGIGTSTPSKKLHVVSAGQIALFESSSSTSNIRLSHSAGTANQFKSVNGKLSIEADVNDTTADSRIAFTIDGSEKVRFDTDGNVGIGTTSPSAKLEVVGTNAQVEIATNDGYSIKSSQKAAIAVVGSGTISSKGSMMAGGSGHHISGDYDTIAGGTINNISGGDFNFIGGGSQIDITGSEYSSSIGGKNNDLFNSDYSVIGGGQNNKIEESNGSFIGGGFSNLNQADFSAIGGGTLNKTTGNGYSFIGGGEGNEVHSVFGGILAGENNIVSGDDSAIVGSSQSKVFGVHSLIAGGKDSVSSGDYSFTLGRQALIPSSHDGAAVFADGQSRDHISSGAHTATLDFAGGVYVPTSGMFGEGLFVSGVPVLTGEINPPEVDTLQTVTTRGNETTTSIISTGPYISGVTGLFSSNVGIGTTSPVDTLDIKDSNPRVRLIDTSVANDPAAYMWNSGGSLLFRADVTQARANTYIRFDIDQSEKLRITDSGNVGIGTTSPNAKLHVNHASDAGTYARLSRGTTNIDFDLGAAYAEITSTIKQFRVGTSDAQSFHLVSNDSNRLSITSSGEVGIGTTSPDNRLEVVGPYAATPFKVLRHGDYGNVIQIGRNGVSETANIGYPADSTINFSTAGSERVRINSSGNVGIGTTSPSAHANLHIAGGPYAFLALQATDSGGRQYEFFSYAADQSFHLYDRTASAYRMTVDETGNVGIGTTNPNVKLHVEGDPNAAGVLGRFYGSATHGALLQFHRGASYNWLAGIGGNSASAGVPSSYFGIVESGNSPRLVIAHTTGNVGIGTTSPSARLHISDSSTSKELLRVGASANGYWKFQNAGSTTSRVSLTAYDSSGNSKIYLNPTTNSYFNNGNVGIGITNPDHTLRVNGDTRLGNLHIKTSDFGVSGTGKTIYADGAGSGVLGFISSTAFDFSNGTTSRLHINSSGNVGIGTTSPSKKLEIASNTTYDGIQVSGTSIPRIAIIDTTNNATLSAYARDNDATIGTESNHPLTLNTNGTERMRISSAGAIKFNNYGAGTFTGTVTQKLGVDSSGNVIEMPIGAGPVDGSGTANYLARWIDSDTLGIGAAYDNGTNVGIGTTNPAAKLHIGPAPLVSGYTSTITTLAVSDTTNGAELILRGQSPRLWFDSSAGGIGEIYLDSTHLNFLSGDPRSGAAGSSSLYIKSNGNVGIGTTSPATKLHIVTSNVGVSTVYADVAIEAVDAQLDLTSSSSGSWGSAINFVEGASTSANTDVWSIARQTTGGSGDSSLRFNFGTSNEHSNDSKITFTSTGRVGIGTTSPNVSIQAESDSSQDKRTLRLAYNSSYYFDIANLGSGGVHYNAVNAGAGGHKFQIDGSEKVRISYAGNVGIGTTSPSEKLHVIGSSSSALNTQYPAAIFQASDAYTGNSGLVTIGGYWDNTNANLRRGYIQASNSTGSVSYLLLNPNGGNVGIGTVSPSTRLQVASPTATSVVLATSYSPTNTNNFFEAGIVANDGYLTLRNSGVVSTVHIDSDGDSYFNGGNVGIGTASPASKLQIDQYTVGSNGSQGTFGNVSIFTNSGSDALYLGVKNASYPNRGYAFKITESGVNSDFTIKEHGLSGDRFTIKSGGNVGIGTTSPSEKLEVAPDTDASAIIGRAHIGKAASNDFATFSHIDHASSTNYALSQNQHGSTKLNYANGRDLSFRRSNVEIGGFNASADFFVDTDTLYVDSSTDRVGIGTTSPTVALDVVGAGKFTGQVTIPATPSASTDAASKGYVDAQVGSADTLQEVTDNGATTTNSISIHNSSLNVNPRLSVGRSSSESIQLHVSDVTNTIQANQDSDSDSNHIFALNRAFGGTGENDFQIQKGGSAQLTINSSGEVGIGTTSPDSKLQVKSSGSNIDEITLVHSGNTVKIAALGQESSHGSLYLRHNNGVAKVRLSAGGNSSYILDSNVGIGTVSPSQKLQINGVEGLPATTGTSQNGLLRLTPNSPTNGETLDFGMRVSGSDSFGWIQATNFGNLATNYDIAINPNGGNVGIGTTSPSANLHVEGATQVKGANSWAGIDTQNGAIYMSDVGQGLLGNLGSNYARPLISTASQTIIIGSSGTSAIRNIKYQAGNGSGVDSEHNFFTSGNNIRLHIATDGKVGIGADTPQRKLDVTLSGNSGVDASFGGLISVGEYQGIHFGYSETTNNLYRKSAIVFERTDSTSNNAQGKIHILNGPQTGSASATLSDAKLTIAENGNVGIGTTSPQAKLQVSGGIQMADDTDTASASKVGTMRYRTGTEYVEVDGVDLVTNGDFATDTNWNKQNGSTVSGGVGNVIAKGNLSSTGGNWALNQNIGMVIGSVYKVSFKVKQTVGTGNFQIGQGYQIGFNQSVTSVFVNYSFNITASDWGVNTGIITIGGATLSDEFEIDNVSVMKVTAEDASYADMCMQTAASTYEWVNIVRNSY